ncbi:MAG: acyl-CoA dehydrogenase family protein, partial [Novosphingobium sp.]
MQFQPSEEQQLFLRALERFLDKEHDFERRRHTATTETAVDPAVWQGLADLGLFMLPFAEGVGGAGLGPVEFGPAMEILGSRLVVEPVLPAILLAGGVLAHAGSAAQRDRWLGPLIAGEARFALADVDAPGNFVRARRSADGWVLDGAKVLAEGAPGADGLIVSSLDEAGVTHLFMVAPDAPGLSLKPVRTVDGARAADIAFQAVPVADAMVLSGDGRAALDAAHHFAAIAACWEAVGVMTAAYRQTADYVRQRQQFGRPLAAFQSVQHRVAEMAVACEEARAAAMLAAFHAADSANSGRTAAGACVKVAASADLVAKAAVQLHGGMGVSDELAIATAFRKLLAFAAGGGMSSQLERYAAQVVDGGRFADSVVLDLAGDAAFRNEVRGFLRERLTDEMCDGQALVSGVFPEPEVSRPWQQALAARGWLAPLWPAEHGGTGWTGVQRIIFETECALAGAPLVFPMGVRLVGSVIIAFGSEEQKRTYLP